MYPGWVQASFCFSTDWKTNSIIQPLGSERVHYFSPLEAAAAAAAALAAF